MPIIRARTRKERLINWMKIIGTNNKEDRKMIGATSPVFGLLNEKIEEIIRTPEEERLFDSRMKMRSDIIGGMELRYEEGRKEGIHQGIERERFILARFFCDMGISLDKISKATGLSIKNKYIYLTFQLNVI